MGFMSVLWDFGAPGRGKVNTHLPHNLMPRFIFSGPMGRVWWDAKAVGTAAQTVAHGLGPQLEDAMPRRNSRDRDNDKARGMLSGVEESLRDRRVACLFGGLHVCCERLLLPLGG